MASWNSPGALRAECVSVQVCEPGGVGEGVWEAELDRTLSEAGHALFGLRAWGSGSQGVSPAVGRACALAPVSCQDHHF